MTQVGTVKAIWHYPVKGMAGDTLEHAYLGEHGVRGDRTWAVQDVLRQEIQSCKFRPQLLQCQAKYANPTKADGLVSVSLPDGEALAIDNPQLDHRLSELLGHQSKLRPLQPAAHKDFYRRYKKDSHTWLNELKETFEREPGEPLPDLDNLPVEMQEYVVRLGTFFLVAPFHVITTASLAHMRELNPQADWREERFRPNLVIDTHPEHQGLIEQNWLGGVLSIGDVRVHCQDPAPRCGAVVRAQQAFNSDRTILRSIVREADQNLGIYGQVIDDGFINVGDAVHLEPSHNRLTASH